MTGYRHVSNPIESVEEAESVKVIHSHTVLYIPRTPSMACEQRGFGRHILGVAVEIKKRMGHHLKILFLWLSAHSKWTIKSPHMISLPTKAKVKGGHFCWLSVNPATLSL